jgi:SAM-dependent methyltransferase
MRGAWDRELDKTQAAVTRLGPWTQNIRLPNGLETAPELGDTMQRVWTEAERRLPPLNGLSVLDIGCRSGLFSFWAASKGATVLGIETDDAYLAQARWLRKRLGFRQQSHGVKFRKATLYSLSRSNSQFDIVLMMNGLEGMRYPRLMIDLAAEKAIQSLVLHVAKPFEIARQDGVAPAVLQVTESGDLNPSIAGARAVLAAAGLDPRTAAGGLFVCEVQNVQQYPELFAATGRPLRPSEDVAVADNDGKKREASAKALRAGESPGQLATSSVAARGTT